MSQYVSSNQGLQQGSERGSTLIAVLFILFIVTVLGVMAMRQGLTSLNISTHAQVRQLMVQSSDAALNQFTQTDLTSISKFSGVFGQALINSVANPGQEFVFCYQPTSTQNFGLALNANVIQGSTTDAATLISGGSANGFCDLSGATALDFGSGRKVAMTQVAVTIPTEAAGTAPGANLSRDTTVSLGSSLPQTLTTTQRLRATATTMLPAFANSSLSTVQTNCLGAANGSTAGRINDNTDPQYANTETVTDCLARYGVPANTQVQEFNLVTTLTQTAAP